jgi:hypothetical protein
MLDLLQKRNLWIRICTRGRTPDQTILLANFGPAALSKTNGNISLEPPCAPEESKFYCQESVLIVVVQN